VGATASGHNKQALQLFREMHVSLYNANHTLKNASQLFPELSDRFQHNASMAQKTNAAFILFGRSGADLLPILGKGGDAMHKLYATFDQMYGRITPEVIKAADEGEESFGRLKLATEGLKFSIGSALFPAMEKLITPLTGWIAANRQLITQRVSEWAANVGNYIKQIDWKGVGNAALGFARAIATVGRTLGPVWTTLLISSVVFSPFINATLGAAGALVKLGWAASVVATKLILIPLASLVTDIIAVIPMIGGMTDAFAALDLVLDANPIGAIVLGVTALAGAAFLVYEYWKPIKAFFASTWSTILAFVPGFAFIGLIKIAKSIIDNWKPITGFFKSMWTDVVGVFTWARNFAVGAWDYAVPELTSAWNSVTGFFKSMWSGVVGVFQWSWKNIVPWIPGLNIVKLIIDNWKPITAFFSTLWKDVTAIFQRMWTIVKPIIDGVVGGAKWLVEHTGLLAAARAIGSGAEAIEKHGEQIEARRALARMHASPGKQRHAQERTQPHRVRNVIVRVAEARGVSNISARTGAVRAVVLRTPQARSATNNQSIAARQTPIVVRAAQSRIASPFPTGRAITFRADTNPIVRFTANLVRTTRAFGDLIQAVAKVADTLSQTTAPSVTATYTTKAVQFAEDPVGTVIHSFAPVIDTVGNAVGTVIKGVQRQFGAFSANAFFRSRGWNANASAAITGNLLWESGLNPAQFGDKGAAYGLAQWHSARAREFHRVMGTALKGSTFNDQLAFVNYELSRGAYKRIGDMLRGAKTLSDATGIVNRFYESPLSPAASQAQRLAAARSTLALVDSRPVISRPLIAKPAGSKTSGKGPTDGNVLVDVRVRGPRGTSVRTASKGKNPPALTTGTSWE
jgi:hypothetical protein